MRATFDDLAFQLELDDRHRLLHLRHEADFLAGERAFLRNFRDEQVARIILVGLEGERCEGQQTDTVAVFQRLHVAVAQAGADYIGDTRFAASGAAHPQNVVISPLDIDLVVFHQRIKDKVRTGAAIIDVADDVESFNCQVSNQFSQTCDEGQRAAGRHDRFDLALVIRRFVFDAFLIVEQFFDGFGHRLGQKIPYRLAAILCAQLACEFYQANQRQLAPLVLVWNRLEHQGRF